MQISDLINMHGHCIEAFLFDLDGTLIDSSKAIINAIKEVLDSKGHFYASKKIIKMIGTPLEEMFRVLIPTLSIDEVWQYVQEYRKYYSIHHLKDTTILPGADRFLRKLREQGFKLGLVTAKYRKPVLEVLAHFNLMELFDTIVTGYEVKRHKPAPDIILEAVKRLGINVSNCAVVGDSPIDVEAGRRAGALTIAVLTGPYGKQEIKKAKPNFILENLESVQI